MEFLRKQDWLYLHTLVIFENGGDKGIIYVQNSGAPLGFTLVVKLADDISMISEKLWSIC